VGRDLERQVLAALAAAAAATLLLVAQNSLAPVQGPLSFGLVFWKWLSLFYCGVGAGAFLLAASVARIARRPGLRALAISAQAVAFGAVLMLWNADASRRLLALEGPASFRWLAPTGFVLAVLVLVGVAFLPKRRQGALRALALLAGATTALALTPTSAAVPEGRLASRKPQVSGERLLVIGLDGADWDLMEPLLARGEMPNIAALRARGAWGRLRTFRPTLSPVVWTTMVTGKPPAQHGVTSFLVTRLAGVDNPLPELRPVHGAGFAALCEWLRAHGRIAEGPVTSSVRRVPAFWNLATLHGSRVSVLNWWATWPAETVLGHVVSERAYYRAVESPATADGERTTFPERLYGDVAKRVVRPREVTLEDARRFMDVSAGEWQPAVDSEYTAERGIVREFPYFYSLFESTRRLALFLIEAGRAEHPEAAPDLLVLFRLVDMTCHTSLVDSELAAGEGEGARKYGRVVSEAYRFVDRAVGELVAAFGPGDLIVVSDHGFDVETRRGARRAHHNRGPDGIFLGAGPAFRSGQVRGLSVNDILPLMAYLKGFPVAEDLAGSVPFSALDDAFVGAHPMARTATYGDRQGAPPAVPGSGEVDREMLERLRALGYVE
jgi:hypothetical protein